MWANVKTKSPITPPVSEYCNYQECKGRLIRAGTIGATWAAMAAHFLAPLQAARYMYVPWAV